MFSHKNINYNKYLKLIMSYYFNRSAKKETPKSMAQKRKSMNQGLCYKIVLSGHIGVGKSNILQRYYRGVFTGQVPTIGVEFQTKMIQVFD